MSPSPETSFSNIAIDPADLSDNAVVVLDGFPLLPRLSMLLVNNNRVARIAAANLERSLPGLETLILTNNRISRLEDLEGLSRLKHLKCLSLMDNPVTKIRGYRSFVINAVPTLRWLDFQRIRPSEREQARSAAPAKDAPGSFVPGEGVPDMETEAGEAGPGEGAAAQEERKRGPTAAELTAIKAAVSSCLCFRPLP